MNEFYLGDYQVGLDSPPFIIAEMSGNHNQSLDKALEIVDAAAEAGAHAVKLQTYTADTMTLNVDMPDFRITDEMSLWYGRHLYELYEEAHTPWEWHEAIFNRAQQKGIICFSTPFDETAVDFLEDLNAPAYKIASFENTDVRLIKKVAATGKPVIISTGMAGLSDLELIVDTLRQASCENFVLLKCTSAYPAKIEDANLRTIPHMRDMFGCQVGLSDHTMGTTVPIASVAFGATVIEKHFCLDRAEGGVDSAFSLEPEELRSLVVETEKAHAAIGAINYGVSSKQESNSSQFKRTLYFSKDLPAGSLITEEAVRAVRPGFGLAIKYYEELLGKITTKPVRKGDRVTLCSYT